jgi:repressor LexA
MHEAEAEPLPQRIKRLRVEILGEKQSTFALRFGVDQSTISKWERGTQVPEQVHLDVIASLEFGEDDFVEEPSISPERRANPLFTVVPAAGYVGAGAVVFLFDGETPSSGDYIKAPKGIGALQALVVRGDSMYPAYKDGDVIFYSGGRAELPIRIGGDDYVVRLSDGSMYLKVVEPNADGSYTLISHNAPPIRNAEIESAFRVVYVRKKFQGRRRSSV